MRRLNSVEEMLTAHKAGKAIAQDEWIIQGDRFIYLNDSTFEEPCSFVTLLDEFAADFDNVTTWEI